MLGQARSLHLWMGMGGATLAMVLAGGVTGPGRAAGAGAGPAPELVGRWTAPFEEGGASTARCTAGAGGRLVCKPVGLAQAITPDGRVFYWSGLDESSVENATVPEIGPEMRNSRSRLLDLRAGLPRFTVPSHDDGGARDPNIGPEGCPAGDPLGVAGVPGRPGDGLVGSLAGGAITGTGTGVQHQPTCTPNTGVSNSGDLFCADVASMADGRFLVVGGTSWYNEPGDGIDRGHGFPADVGAVELQGLRSARIFDPSRNDWEQVAPMKYSRWYPSEVTLPDGRILVAGGSTKLIKSTQGSQVRRTEIYDPAARTWTEAFTGPQSENSLPLMARLFLTPDGGVFYGGAGQTFGPMGQAVDEALWSLQQIFDPASRRWRVTGVNPLGVRGGAAEVMLPMSPPYDRATLLTFGGTLGPTPGSQLATPLAQLTTVDSAGHVQNSMTGALHHPRWFSPAVSLPDGSVLALNGGDKDEVVAPGTEAAVRTPELFDPAAGVWTDMAPAARERTYHNSAVLLPDGRVLSGGHSPIATLYGSYHTLLPGVTAHNGQDPSFEVFSPPYLFRGARPRITHAPAGLAWGDTVSVGVDDPASIGSVVLMRTPSNQHITDSDARTLQVHFTRTAGGLAVTVPPSGVVAPPGAYYLFVNRTTPQGPVPSVARIVLLGAGRDQREAVQPYPDDPAAPAGGAATPPESTAPVVAPPAAAVAPGPAAPVDARRMQAARLSAWVAAARSQAPLGGIVVGAGLAGLALRWATASRRRRRERRPG
jgi:hypothetical protein